MLDAVGQQRAEQGGVLVEGMGADDLFQRVVDLVGAGVQLRDGAAPGGHGVEILQGHPVVGEGLQKQPVAEIELVADVGKGLKLGVAVGDALVPDLPVAVKAGELRGGGAGVDDEDLLHLTPPRPRRPRPRRCSCAFPRRSSRGR